MHICEIKRGKRPRERLREKERGNFMKRAGKWGLGYWDVGLEHLGRELECMERRTRGPGKGQKDIVRAGVPGKGRLLEYGGPGINQQ